MIECPCIPQSRWQVGIGGADIGLQCFAQLHAVGNQRRQVWSAKGDAGSGFAVVLDFWRLMTVMGKGRSQFRVFGVRLGVVPANSLFAAKDGVAVVENLAVRQVEVFKEAQFKAVTEMDTPRTIAVVALLVYRRTVEAETLG